MLVLFHQARHENLKEQTLEHLLPMNPFLGSENRCVNSNCVAAGAAFIDKNIGVHSSSGNWLLYCGRLFRYSKAFAHIALNQISQAVLATAFFARQEIVAKTVSSVFSCLNDSAHLATIAANEAMDSLTHDGTRGL